jgi:hypothetical protein
MLKTILVDKIMMKNWLKILPYFFVEYLSKKHCEVIKGYSIGDIHTSFKDSYIITNTNKYENRGILQSSNTI